MSKKTNPRPNLKPLESDPIRRALKQYLADLEIIRDDPGGVTVTTSSDLRNSDNESRFLEWYAINAIVSGLGGRWIGATKWSRGHWRVPHENTAKRNY
jgi:hypothetical protein